VEDDRFAIWPDRGAVEDGDMRSRGESVVVVDPHSPTGDHLGFDRQPLRATRKRACRSPSPHADVQKMKKPRRLPRVVMPLATANRSGDILQLRAGENDENPYAGVSRTRKPVGSASDMSGAV